MVAELARVDQWLYTTLAADSTISSVVGTRIYAHEAPQETAFPLVLFAHIGNAAVLNSFGNGRVAKVIYLVRAVVSGSSVNPILAVADRFDPLLLTSKVTVGPTYINYVQFFQHAIRKDSENGVPLSYLGSYYYIFCQPAP